MTDAPDRLTPEEVKASCDAQVARTARPLMLVTAGLLAVFTLVTPFVTPFPASVPIAVGQAVLACAFYGAYLALRSGGRAVRFVHPMFGLLTFGALGSIVVTYAQTGSTLLTSGVVILIVAAGVIALSWPWVIAIVTIYSFGWIATLLIFETPPLWTQIVFTIAAADMLAIMAHAARYRTHLDLEALHRHDARQRSELLESLGALRTTEARLRSVVRAAPVILLATDLTGRVTVAEGSGLVARGWDKVELVGLQAREMLSILPEEVARMENALGGEASSGVTQHEGRSYETIWSPTFEADGSLGGAICVATDVTDRMNADAEARRAEARESDIAKLLEMDRFKTRILNTASHELNTPLTPIKLQMYLLKASFTGMDAKQKRAVDVIERNVDRLASLVADIMDVARLQEGQLRLVPVEARMDEVVREAGASYEAVAQSKSIELVIEPGKPLTMHVDPKRILQIMFNLLGNAMKFTPNGGRVEVVAQTMGEHLELSVRDTGPGLTQEQIGRLFHPFSQVHDMNRTTFGGTGLGLYISRGIAVQHGGDLRCESDGLGKGTAFILRIPLSAPLAPSA